MMYLYRQSGAGTLFVRSDSGAEAWVSVQNGRAVAARTTDGGADLLQALLPACGFMTGEFAFYDGDHLETVDGSLSGAPTITGSLDPYSLLYASLRDHARDDMVDAVLARYPFAKLSLPRDRDVDRLNLDEDDKAVVDSLRLTPASIDEVTMSSALPGLHTRRLLYALLVTHMLTPEETRATDLYKSQVDMDSPVSMQAPAPSPPAPSPARSARTTLTDAQRANVVAEPKPGAPRVVIKPPVAGTVNDVASASMPAWVRLISMRPPGAPSGDPRKTGDFGQVRAPSPLRGSLATAPNDPAAKRRRAEQLMQGSRFAEALALIDELIGAEPADAKLHGLRARSLFEVHRTDGELPRAVMDAVKRAHELDADEANAYFVRGLLYKQVGEMQKAVVCWKRALQTDAKHIDALREVRLAQMRK
jgi:tetratricopeptide (TPR) repeat protein